MIILIILLMTIMITPRIIWIKKFNVFIYFIGNKYISISNNNDSKCHNYNNDDSDNDVGDDSDSCWHFDWLYEYQYLPEGYLILLIKGRPIIISDTSNRT